ncbi:efflux RND transporter periplasmic adaptor subunit [Rhodobacterales bacterium HKCCE2091]|nr:efflux RND transporter periplasmic adaptor subunit [Rhodobacterales bacterium HKCCE2091]
MRIFPIVTAALVCTVLYFAILNREALVSFASRFGGADAETVDTGDTAEAAMAEADTPAPANGVAEGSRVVRVVARHVTAQITADALLLRGRTEAARQVTVAAETSGLIVSDPIRAGAFVEAGTVLCQIDSGTREAQLAEARAALATARARLPEAEAQVAGAEAALEAARIDQNAASRLSESGFASETRAATAASNLRAAEATIRSAQAGVEAAQSGVLSAEAAVSAAEQEIGRLAIRAPFAGHLESDTAELGALMQPGSPCATVIQLDPMKLVGFVPESEVDRVAVGAAAGARLSTGAEVRGEVTFLSRAADPATRTFRVEITVPNEEFAIRDGQSADILVQTEGTPAHLLPSSALTLDDDGRLGIRAAIDGVARFVPVRVIRDTTEGVLVAGLPEEADVITVGQEFVTDGVPVDVTYAEGAAP